MEESGWVSLPGSRRATQALPPAIGGSAGGAATEPLLALLLAPLAAVVLAILKKSDETGGVEVHPASGRLRQGRRTASFSDIGTARLVGDPTLDGGLHLLLEGGRIAFRVPMHDGQEITLAERARELLLRLLPHTSIAMPASHYDPKGKFAKYNFPSYITKGEAIALVEKPPSPGDPLPIPS